MLIGITGKKFNGKSTLAMILCNHGFIEKSFADPLKKACRELFLLSDEQLYGSEKETPDDRWFGITPRKLLQFVGTDLLRNQMDLLIPELKQDIFIHNFELWYNANMNIKVVISDIRFQNELDIIKSLGGIVIKVERNLDYETDNHISEKGIDELKGIDYVISNNSSIEELEKSIIEIINKL